MSTQRKSHEEKRVPRIQGASVKKFKTPVWNFRIIIENALGFCPLDYYVRVEKLLGWQSCFGMAELEFKNLIENLTTIGKGRLSKSKRNLVFSILYYLYLKIQQDCEKNYGLSALIKAISERICNRLANSPSPKPLKLKKSESVQMPASVKPLISLEKVSEISKSFSVKFPFCDDTDKPIIEKMNEFIPQQTFPTDSFKRSTIILSKKTSFGSSKTTTCQQFPKNISQIPPQKYSQTIATQEKISFEAKTGLTKTSFDSKVSQPQNSVQKQVKFQSPPKEKKSKLEDKVPSIPNQPQKSINLMVTEPTLLGSPQSVKFISPKKEEWDQSEFGHEPKKFFNSKSSSGYRKMTENLKESSIKRKQISLVSNNLNSKFFEKIDIDDSAKVAVEISEKIDSIEPSMSLLKPIKILEQREESSLSTKSPSTLSKLSDVKIEKIVSKSSINSAIENLTCKAMNTTIIELKTMASTLLPPRCLIRNALQNLLDISFLGEDLKVREYGSFVTGLLTPFSDMDLCIVTPRKISTRNEANLFLARLQPLLAKIAEISYSKHIDTASVPVIKITAKFEHFSKTETLHIDLTAEISEENNEISTAFRTTTFICECIEKYPSFLPVVLCLKYVLNLAGLNDSYRGGLNAYGLSLAYIAFLNIKKRLTSTNHGRLLREFIRFLIYEFDPMTEALCFSYQMA